MAGLLVIITLLIMVVGLIALNRSDALLQATFHQRDLATVATRLGLAHPRMGAQFYGVLANTEIVLRETGPGFIGLRDSRGRLRGLDVRRNLQRRLRDGRVADPLRNLGDEATALAFLRGDVRDETTRWIVDEGLVIENGELRLASVGDVDRDVEKIRRLSELLALLCRTPDVVRGLVAAAREEPAVERRKRAVELFVTRFRGDLPSVEVFRTASGDADLSIRLLGGIFSEELRDAAVASVSPGDFTAAFRTFAPDVRGPTLAELGKTGARAASHVAQILTSEWIEDYPAAMRIATNVLAGIGTPAEIQALAVARDRAGSRERRSAISEVIGAIRTRFPDQGADGRLSIAVPAGELSLAQKAGALSVPTRTKPD